MKLSQIHQIDPAKVTITIDRYRKGTKWCFRGDIKYEGLQLVDYWDAERESLRYRFKLPDSAIEEWNRKCEERSVA